MIKAVFFDVDGTLYDFVSCNAFAIDAVCAYMKEQRGVERETWIRVMDDAFAANVARLGAYAPAIHNRQIRYQNALQALGIPIYPDATRMYHLFWDTILEHAVPEKGLIPLLALLKEKGIYIGTGTDMTSYIQNKKLEKLGIAQYFDGAVTSEEAGSDKPDPRIFRLGLAQAGCRPGEALFIGDHPTKDIAGARGVGMYAACYYPHTHAPGLEEIEPQWRIGSFTDCVDGDTIRIGELVL